MWRILKRYLAAYLLGTVCLVLGSCLFAKFAPDPIFPGVIMPPPAGFFILLGAVWLACIAYALVVAVKNDRWYMLQTALAFVLLGALLFFSSLVAVLVWSAAGSGTGFWQVFEAFFLRPVYFEDGEGALQGGNLKGTFAVVLGLASVCGVFAVALQAVLARAGFRFKKIAGVLLGLAAIVLLIAAEELLYTLIGRLVFFGQRKNYDIATALLILAGCAVAQYRHRRKGRP